MAWSPPATDGGSPITAYTVTSEPDGIIVQVDGSITQATVAGLTNGLTYTFAVTATNAVGTGSASDPSNPVIPTYPQPTLEGFTPGAAGVGYPVTIFGTHLLTAQDVSFAGTSATFEVVSDTEITAVLPDGAVTGPIGVVTGGGSATTPNAFASMPTISAFSPTSGPKRSTVVVSGSGFFAATKLCLDGRPTPFVVDSYWSLSFVVPRLGTSGPITVVTKAGKARTQTSFIVTGKVADPRDGSGGWVYSAPPISRL